jgi:hypothetical protein
MKAKIILILIILSLFSLSFAQKKEKVKQTPKKTSKLDADGFYVEEDDEGDDDGGESVLKKPSDIQTKISRKKTLSTYEYSKNKRAKIRKTNRLLY